jgi:acetolactate synthase regulatory subunit
MEVHSPEDLEVVQKMLRQRGFAFIIQQADQLANSGIFNCFAIRE